MVPSRGHTARGPRGWRLQDRLPHPQRPWQGNFWVLWTLEEMLGVLPVRVLLWLMENPAA